MSSQSTVVARPTCLIFQQIFSGFGGKRIKKNGLVSNPDTQHLGSVASLCVLAFGLHSMGDTVYCSAGADDCRGRTVVELCSGTRSRCKGPASSELANRIHCGELAW